MTGVAGTLAVSVGAVAVIASGGTDVEVPFSDAVSDGTPAGVSALAVVDVSWSESEGAVIAVGASFSVCGMRGETISPVPVGVIVVALVASTRPFVSVGRVFAESGETTDSVSRLTMPSWGVSDAVGASFSVCGMRGETISPVPVGVIVVALVASTRPFVSVGRVFAESGETTDSVSRLTMPSWGVSDKASLTSSSAL